MHTMQKKIAIVGAGRIGTALSRIFEEKKYDVSLWDKEEGKIPGQKDIAEIVSEADIVFLCVPSWALREVCGLISKSVPHDAVIVSMAKGIERDTLKTPEQIMGEFFPIKTFGMIGGPMLAEELNLDHVGVAMLGYRGERVREEIEEAFRDTSVRVKSTKDMHGVALGGVLKNVYALAFGIVDGLKWSGNAKGWLLVESMEEISKLSRVLGGRKKTVLDIAGLGDLATCGFSEYSRNRKAGQDVLEDGKFDIKSEGVISAPSVFVLAKRKTKKLRVLAALQDIIERRKDPREVFKALLENI